MKQLLNTLFVTSEDIYLSLEGENVLANREKNVVARYPLHTLQTIVSFSYSGASPALMGACAERGIGLAFCTPRGRFLARTCGESSGNVLLRREQYRIADDVQRSCEIARCMIFGKLSNSAASIQRTCRDHGPRVEGCGLEEAAQSIRELLPPVLSVTDLDAYVGFLHRDRPGRNSLALDLMEELRPCMADRFVLTLVNNRMVKPEDFQIQDSGAVLLTDDGRRKFLKTWQERKRDTLTHPYLNEKLSWGMIPYVQALLLARFIRGDLDAYPPFLWK